MSEVKSEFQELLDEVKSNCKQKSINKVDEVRVMRGMLNDPNFTIGVYDRKLGYVGQRCPREEAVTFAKNIISATTGLDGNDSKHLAESYEFTKRDATFLLDNMRDFANVYTQTGRKLNIIQNETTEATVSLKHIEAKTKSVPDKDNPGQTKQVETVAFDKLVSSSKCPKYLSK